MQEADPCRIQIHHQWILYRYANHLSSQANETNDLMHVVFPTELKVSSSGI